MTCQASFARQREGHQRPGSVPGSRAGTKQALGPFGQECQGSVRGLVEAASAYAPSFQPAAPLHARQRSTGSPLSDSQEAQHFEQPLRPRRAPGMAHVVPIEIEEDQLGPGDGPLHMSHFFVEVPKNETYSK